MGLVDYLPLHPVEVDPKLTELDNTFVVAQFFANSRLLKSVAKQNPVELDRTNDVIGETRLGRELRQRKEVAACFETVIRSKFVLLGTQAQKMATILFC